MRAHLRGKKLGGEWRASLIAFGVPRARRSGSAGRGGSGCPARPAPLIKRTPVDARLTGQSYGTRASVSRKSAGTRATYLPQPARAAPPKPRATLYGRPDSAGLSEAGEGTRTLDLRLGKPTLYQLSYAREAPSLAVSRESPRAGNRSAASRWTTGQESSRACWSNRPGSGGRALRGLDTPLQRHRLRHGPFPRRCRRERLSA